MMQAEFVHRISERSGLTLADTGRVLDAIGDVLAEQLALGDSIRHAAIGTFSVKDRPASKGRNPRTGEKIQIAAKRVPKFSPAKALKDRLNEAPPAEPRRMVGFGRK
jgi:DNA-binding protein HU-beta